MANSKISALSSASTPLTGTEVLPIVQSSTTDQVTVANLTAGRAVSALSFTAPTIGAASGSALSLQSNGTTNATLDATGNFLVGTTTYGVPSGSSFQVNPTYTLSGHVSGTASGQGYAYYYYNANNIGSITQNGTTGVLYNITSDYRLKSNPTKITNGVATINQLNPVTFTWTPDNSTDSGFLAHEFQSVLPRSVTGTKDAVDAEGKPVYQAMDNSGAVPYLVAAIQELSAQVTALQAQVTTLQGKA